MRWLFVKTRISKNNEILMEDIDLPIDYGETCADEAMKPINDRIQRIIHIMDNLRESVDEEEIDKE